jgi:hypothetical protein
MPSNAAKQYLWRKSNEKKLDTALRDIARCENSACSSVTLDNLYSERDRLLRSLNRVTASSTTSVPSPSSAASVANVSCDEEREDDQGNDEAMDVSVQVCYFTSEIV